VVVVRAEPTTTGLSASRVALVVDGPAARIGAWARRRVARTLVAQHLELTVAGQELVPASGPAIVAARHYHHLYDAAAIMATLPREVHILVALDWLHAGWPLYAMRWLTRAAQWPAVWRGGAGRPAPLDAWRLNARALADSVALLRAGGLLLVFPEGYPVVDPEGSRQPAAAPFLPMQSGVVALALRAQRAGGTPVPIVPAGFWYEPLGPGRWRVALRFGTPVRASARAERAAALAAIESSVRGLSGPPPRQTRH